MIDFDDFDPEPSGDALEIAKAGVLPDGYSTGQVPPEFLCREDRLLWQRVTLGALLGQTPTNPTDKLVRAVLDETRAEKGGKQMKVAAVLAAIRIAVAEAHGVRIRTHMRGIARHLGVRYQTLLRIRTTAKRVIQRDGYRLDLPDWLKWDWG